MSDTTVNPHAEYAKKIHGEETFDPLSGTSRVFFEQGDIQYEVEADGPRYLIIAKPTPGARNGIIIPDTYRPQQTVGWIVGIGDGRYDPDTGKFVPPKRKVGDLVLFGEHAGTKVTLGSQEYRIMQYDSVLGCLTPQENEG